MNKPKVSIILATYNRAHFLDAAIKSVRSQSLQDWELIISDDASTDGTADKIRDWRRREPRIVYRRNKKNRGISGNYNEAIRTARGEYCAMLDDDDNWIGADKLKEQVEFLDAHPNHVGVGGGMAVVDEKGKELFRYLKPETDKQIRRSMFFSNPMANSTTLFRRAAAVKADLYDEDIAHGADRDFWLRMGKLGKLHNIPEYFAYYTLAGQNALFRHQRVMFRCILKFLPKYKNDYPLFAPGMLFNYGVYGYSLIPFSVRALLNYPLFYLKRAVFDRTK